MTDDLWRLDATELARLIRLGRVSSRAATQSCLSRLHAVNPAINAVVRVLEEEALAAADAADAARARGDALGPLHGVPVTVKANTDQAGCPTDNGVVAFRDAIATEDSPVVANLKRAGAIIIGRTNTPAFSMRIFADNALHGRTLNPRDPSISAGGSSGGRGSHSHRHWADRPRERHWRICPHSRPLQRRGRATRLFGPHTLVQPKSTGCTADWGTAHGGTGAADSERARCPACAKRHGSRRPL